MQDCGNFGRIQRLDLFGVADKTLVLRQVMKGFPAATYIEAASKNQSAKKPKFDQ